MSTIMSIHRALAEIKLYDKKIYDTMNKKFVMAEKTRYTKIDGVSRDELEMTMEANLQSLMSLMTNRQRLKNAIVVSNTNTFVNIAGEPMSVADAIERKNFLDIKKTVMQNLISQFNRANAQVLAYENGFQEGLERYINAATRETANAELIASLTKSYKELNEVELINPCELHKVIETMKEEIEKFENEVDYALSESNAVTMIEVDLVS